MKGLTNVNPFSIFYKNGVIMDIRQRNIDVFNDTMRQIKNSPMLAEAVEHSIKNQVFYSDGSSMEYFKSGKTAHFPEPVAIEVSQRGSFDAARRYSGSICVLNFASATNPGGGVDKGANAQEECLCRCSTLYPCLSIDGIKNVFYAPHRANGTALHNDDIIYTPKVKIIKSDNYNNLFSYKDVNVITCAAPNLRETPANAYNHENGEGVKVSNEELQKLHESRALKILSCAAFHMNDTVILGAFGCGAFKNPPEIVASAYKKVIDENFTHTFKHIEFAVYCGRDDTNYQVFKSVFED